MHLARFGNGHSNFLFCLVLVFNSDIEEEKWQLYPNYFLNNSLYFQSRNNFLGHFSAQASF